MNKYYFYNRKKFSDQIDQVPVVKDVTKLSVWWSPAAKHTTATQQFKSNKVGKYVLPADHYSMYY